MLMPFASQTPLIQFVIEATAKERAKGRPFGGPFSDTVAGLVNMAMVIMAASAFHEGHSDVAEIELAFMIDGAPEIAELAVDLHERLIQMPTPLRIEAHVRYPLLSDLGGEHRAKPVPPKPDGLMADVDPPLNQEILDVAQRQRIFHVHHHDQTNHL